MPFQRSFSKVWWGSEQQLPVGGGGAAAGSSFTSGGYYYSSLHAHQQQQQHLQSQGTAHAHSKGFGGYHSLEFQNFKSYPGNLSRIQEVDDEKNASKLSWEKRDSPGSLRSQDSGFSDNDESHSTRSMGGRSSKPASPASIKSAASAHSDAGSPTSICTSVATPPTVVRRVGRSEFYSPLVSVSRRISFCASPNASQKAAERSNQRSADGTLELDDIQLLESSGELEGESGIEGTSQKRRRRIHRRTTRPLTPTKRRPVASEESTEVAITIDSGDELELAAAATTTTVPAYNNETVFLGATPMSPPAYNNETVVFGQAVPQDVSGGNSLDGAFSPLRQSRRSYTAQTSTPKASATRDFAPPHTYENPLLNGHSPSLQSWLDGLRLEYEQEVMSTLQTKSIAQEAFKNLTITTNTVAKLIRQLQQRAMCLQADFERVERLLRGAAVAALHEALACTDQLLENVGDFAQILERRAVFFRESRVERRKYDEHLMQVRLVAKDTRYSLQRQHYMGLEALLEDLHLLRRHVLFTVRALFEQMVRVIVQSVEQGRCDLMLRANINMIATLMNIDYEGFASLTDAFVQCEAVRTLLVVCLEHRLSSVRALALRALATVCCAPEAIEQLGACGGVEILRDILQVQGAPLQRSNSGGGAPAEVKRGDAERREAVSLLTQITAAWHGPEHRVEGLRDCIETLVEGLTQLVVQTNCAQTLLLCAAALNNLSRTEFTSHYSIMSNEAIFRLIEAAASKEDGISIFFYEQVVAMLHNMSLNKKCHSHLANAGIINFITSAYGTEFYKSYGSRAESEAQRRAVKAILHTITRLVHDSSLGVELLEQQRIPAFLRLATAGLAAAGDHSLPPDSVHSRDISLLARQLLLSQQQEQQERRAKGAAEAGHTDMKFNLTRQESYV